MTPTQILDHCKAVVEGKAKTAHPFVTVEPLDHKYMRFVVGWSHREGLGVVIHDTINDIDCALAALLLGLTEPAPIVLEWVEGAEGVLIATFNHLICARCIPVGDDGWCGYVYLDGTMMDECGISDLKNTQSWCLTTITELVTPKP